MYSACMHFDAKTVEIDLILEWDFKRCDARIRLRLVNRTEQPASMHDAQPMSMPNDTTRKEQPDARCKQR